MVKMNWGPGLNLEVLHNLEEIQLMSAPPGGQRAFNLFESTFKLKFYDPPGKRQLSRLCVLIGR